MTEFDAYCEAVAECVAHGHSPDVVEKPQVLLDAEQFVHDFAVAARDAYEREAYAVWKRRD